MKPGDTLGPYRILEKIGEGGMGEVYKANDTRLDRTVALKVVPAALAADPQFCERFKREAKSISALNHPNICTLFDVGESALTNPAGHAEAGSEILGRRREPPIPGPVLNYLVMECLEGETLAARLERGALPLADALKVATEIASALDKAHRLGIVHRDLKPGNIVLVKAGGARSDATQAKLLDFGLAKSGPSGALSAAAPTALATSPRPTAQALTARGTILGTFQYMAPEQIDGEEADARTDLFAFGAVLFEMLTGRKAFAGKSQASLIGAILKDEPSAVSQVQPLVPPALDFLVRTCLAKDPDARFQTAHDLLLHLKWIAEGGSAAGVAAPVVAHRRNRERLAWIAAATLGVALVVTATMLVMHLREAPPVMDPTEFTISAPESSFFGWPAPQFAVSPDGRQVVFAASLRGVNALWVRPLSTAEATPLPGIERATYPFWSHDSRFVAFFAAGKLKKVQVNGGSPVEIGDAPFERGGTWNQDNVILFAPTRTGPLHRISSAGGGTSTPVTELAKGETSHRWPTFLPDGHHYVYFVGTGDGSTGEIRAGSLEAKETVAVAASDSNGVYAAGHMVFVRRGSLMALPFNPDTRQSTADAFPVAQQATDDSAAFAAVSVSTTGVLTYARGNRQRQLTWFDQAGTSLGTVGEPGDYANVSLSRDERRVAVTLSAGSPANPDIWLFDRERAGAKSRFTVDLAPDFLLLWSPDGAQLAFVSSRLGPRNIYVKPANADLSVQEELVLKSATNKMPSDWSRKGDFLAYTDHTVATGVDLWVLQRSGEKWKPSLFLQTPSNEDNAVFSPDVRWIAYDSNEFGTTQIYVRPFPLAPGQTQSQVSLNGGVQPMWRRDGEELFFLAPDGTLMSASISTAKGFVPGPPKALFRTGVVFTNRHLYAVAKNAKDGKRFLVIVPEQGTNPSPITVVVNWLALLKEEKR